MIMTRAVAAMTHAMSPESSAKFRSPPKRISAGNPTRRITLRVRRFGSCWIRARRGWGPNRGLGEQLDPDSVRVCDVRPPAGRRLHVEDDGVARLLRLRERLVEVLDLERQVVESFADDVVRREAAPILVIVELEDETAFLAREAGRSALRRVDRAPPQVFHAEDLRVERDGRVEVFHANPRVCELRLHGPRPGTVPGQISDRPSSAGSVSFRPSSPAREAHERDDGKGDAGESDAVRDELR